MSLTETYLDRCLKDGRTVRWPDRVMPIKVYIAPFRWYEKSKQREANLYNGMVLESMDRWKNATGGMVRFQLVSRQQDSQINLEWRRVDRKSLGHCEYLVNDKSMVYSAEISIGLSDNVIHSQYNNPDEVRHTILHEFGHALGLIGHSDGESDIMFVPHQYGVVDISARDINTIQWLYKLPVGFDYVQAGQNYKLAAPFSIHDVIDRIAGKKIVQPEVVKPPPPPEQPEVLLSQHDILSHQGKFFLATQNIHVPKDLKTRIVEKKYPPNPPV
jgi:hypothetical protein